MKVTVTGAGGYIGSVLVPMLLEAGHEVTALDRFFFGETLARASAARRSRRHDSRFTTLADLEGAEALIDLVAISNDPSGEEFRNETLAINWRARATHAALAKEAGVGATSCPRPARSTASRTRRRSSTRPGRPIR